MKKSWIWLCLFLCPASPAAAGIGRVGDFDRFRIGMISAGWGNYQVTKLSDPMYLVDGSAGGGGGVGPKILGVKSGETIFAAIGSDF